MLMGFAVLPAVWLPTPHLCLTGLDFHPPLQKMVPRGLCVGTLLLPPRDSIPASAKRRSRLKERSRMDTCPMPGFPGGHRIYKFQICHNVQTLGGMDLGTMLLCFVMCRANRKLGFLRIGLRGVEVAGSAEQLLRFFSFLFQD